MVTAALVVALGSAATAATNQFWLAAQFDWSAKRGFYVSLESGSTGDAPCKADAIKLVLAVGDGGEWRYVFATPKWEIGRDYAVKATIGPGSSELWVDGQSAGCLDCRFAPGPGEFKVNTAPGWASAPADYIVLQRSVQVRPGARKPVAFSFEKESARPTALLLFEPQLPRSTGMTVGKGDTITIEARFRLMQYPDLRKLAPFIDEYGQCRHADWPGKIKTDGDLKRGVREEQKRLSEMGEPKRRDRFGGSTTLGWREKPTGFYRLAKRGGFHWLITPEGNPCFYTGLCTAPSLNWEMTPTTGREYLWEWLPPKEGDYGAAWGSNVWGDSPGTDFFAPHTANLMRKYGDDWRKKALESTARRLKVWGFSGVGKWSSLDNTPILPVLSRSGVPNVVDHPDVFDPEVRRVFREALEKQIAPRRNDPLVVGWSVGNEIGEVILATEARRIVEKADTSPLRRAVIDEVVKTTYGGDTAKAAAAWGVQASELADLHTARIKPPAPDIESMRRHYASAYYKFIYETVKSIDPDHLYFGFWIVPGWWENEEDWRIAAPYCDAIGYDYYASEFTSEWLEGLIKQAAKPVLCGEFSFPAWYGGAHGFGVYPAVHAEDDAKSGESYARWIEAAAKNPFCVGALWFEYRDQPLTGRGAGHPGGLVNGEHYAFGAVDVGDRPKWDLVERMRKANLSAAGARMKATGVHGP